jgi:hypothetical protein
MWLLALGAAALGAAPARAEPLKLEAADGPKSCREFDERNDKQREEWEKAQPPIPYEYPQKETVLHAPWGGLLGQIVETRELLLATIIPHAGAQLRGDEPAAIVSWPWSVPFGPAFTCTRKEGAFSVDAHRAHRAMIEPGVISSNRGVGVFTRPGYRFIHHPSDWVVGVGGGLGSTVEIAGNREPFRLSISPEALLRFGHCCDSGYFTLAFRYDRFFAGGVKDVVTGSLGFVYF